MGTLLLAFLAVAGWRERKGSVSGRNGWKNDKGVKERGFDCLTGKAIPFSHSWWEETGPLVFSLAGQLSLTLVGWSLSGSGLTFEVLLWVVNLCEVVRNCVQHAMQCFSSNDLSTYFSQMPNNSTTKAVECNRWGRSLGGMLYHTSSPADWHSCKWFSKFHLNPNPKFGLYCDLLYCLNKTCFEKDSFFKSNKNKNKHCAKFLCKEYSFNWTDKKSKLSAHLLWRPPLWFLPEGFRSS